MNSIGGGGTKKPRAGDNRRSPISLHAFITRLIWLCVLPLVAVAAYLAFENVQRARVDRDQQAIHLAHNFTTGVDQFLLARAGALGMLASSPLVDEAAGWQRLYDQALGFQRSFGSHVIFADTDLQMRFNTRVPFGTPLPRLPQPKTNGATATTR